MAVDKGPYSSAFEDKALTQIQVETREKVAHGFVKIYRREDLKKNLLHALKLSPLAMTPHTSRKYRAILDLSLQMIAMGYMLLSVK